MSTDRVVVTYGRDHPDDDEIDWSDKRVMTRAEAAKALAEARADQWATRRDGSKVRLPFPTISIGTEGFVIYAGPNPAWQYAA